MTANLHTLVGAYALDALTTDDQQEFEQHLPTCTNCGSDLVELRATAARLSDTTWQSPPAEMKARLMDAVANTAQERPRVATMAGRERRRFLPALLAAAAVLAVLVSLGAFLVERDRLSEAQREQAAMVAVLSAPDVEQQVARLENGATVRMLMSPSLDEAVVTMMDLPALTNDQSYQMWRMQPGGPDPEAVISAEQSSDSVARVIDDLDDTQAIAVTVEPAGGSDQPTTRPVVTLELT